MISFVKKGKNKTTTNGKKIKCMSKKQNKKKVSDFLLYKFKGKDTTKTNRDAEV